MPVVLGSSSRNFSMTGLSVVLRHGVVGRMRVAAEVVLYAQAKDAGLFVITATQMAAISACHRAMLANDFSRCQGSTNLSCGLLAGA